jgi:hypothetical protein
MNAYVAVFYFSTLGKRVIGDGGQVAGKPYDPSPVTHHHARVSHG